MIPDLKPYPAMKDSGVEWLGAVPEHWEVRRLRNTSEMRVSNVDKHAKDDEQPVRLCNYVDVYKNERIRSGMAFMRATATTDEIERFRLQSGDVLITKDSEAWNDIGVPALVEDTQDDIVSGYHLALLRPFPERVDGGYLFRALQSTAVTYQFHVEANGVTRYGLSHSAIKSVWLPLAPLPEQAAIVRYLDHADRRIRRYIRAKQKLVKLLEEQKQAVIYQIVTGRIDVRTGQPYPAYKPSGVEWLGDVPEHWKILPLKRWVSTKITDGPHETPALLDDGIPFMSAESMVGGRLDFSRRRGFISRGQHEIYCRKCRPRRDDIFMCKSGATTGKVAIVETADEFSVWSPLALIRVESHKVLARLLFAVLQTLYVQRQVQDTWSYGTQPNLAMRAMERLVVVLPPIDEQQEVLAHLDRTTKKPSEAIDRAHREISLLREYRTCLIADVVTGKLDVREAAAGLPDEVKESEPFDETSALIDGEEEPSDDLDAVPEEAEV